ncbi:MAG TPA: hypothetical protein VIS06_06030, partial [Mycobacteriales bacterium]
MTDKVAVGDGCPGGHSGGGVGPWPEPRPPVRAAVRHLDAAPAISQIPDRRYACGPTPHATDSHCSHPSGGPTGPAIALYAAFHGRPVDGLAALSDCDLAGVDGSTVRWLTGVCLGALGRYRRAAEVLLPP